MKRTFEKVLNLFDRDLLTSSSSTTTRSHLVQNFAFWHCQLGLEKRPIVLEVRQVIRIEPWPKRFDVRTPGYHAPSSSNLLLFQTFFLSHCCRTEHGGESRKPELWLKVQLGEKVLELWRQDKKEGGMVWWLSIYSKQKAV